MMLDVGLLDIVENPNVKFLIARVQDLNFARQISYEYPYYISPVHILT